MSGARRAKSDPRRPAEGPQTGRLVVSLAQLAQSSSLSLITRHCQPSKFCFLGNISKAGRPEPEAAPLQNRHKAWSGAASRAGESTRAPFGCGVAALRKRAARIFPMIGKLARYPSEPWINAGQRLSKAGMRTKVG